jgi:AraC family transcriptional activator of pobA
MTTPTRSDPAIQSYSLFGESTHLPDVMHCETIAERSVLHDWELAPHRHARLHQVMLVESGGGLAHLDEQAVPLTPGCVVNVPAGHVHAFRFEKGTQGWVVTLADELLDEILAHVGDVRQSLARCCIQAGDAQVASLMGQIWQEYQASAPARALVLRGLSATLLGWMARSLASLQNHGPATTESRLVQRLRALIDQHYLAHWSVADYARHPRCHRRPRIRADRSPDHAGGAPTLGLHASEHQHHRVRVGVCRPSLLHTGVHP